jgi:hypothetical protein
MARNYNRVCRLLVQSSSEALQIEGLRIAFEIIKDLYGHPNLARISVYNLSITSRNKIQDEFEDIIFNVGYSGRVKTLYVGQIKNVTHVKNGPDIITTIYSGDGQRDFEQSFSSFTLAEGSKLGDIINRVVSDFGETTLGLVQGVDTNQGKLLGYTVSKPTKNVLNELGNEYNFDWTIEQGMLKIISRDSFEDVEFKITPNTGMLNTPAITEIGVDVTTLLNPEVLPGRTVYVSSETTTLNIQNLEFRDRATVRTNADGRYKVQKVVYSGDTHTDEWYNMLTCKAL